MISNNLLMTAACLLFLLQHSGLAFATSCSVSTTSVNFGNYDVFNPIATATTGTITVTCTPLNAPFSIAINGGMHGTINQRSMTQASGDDAILYNVYTDPTHSINWGDGTGSSSMVNGTSNQPIQVYGMAAGGQDVSAGLYSDMVTVTVSF